MTRPPRFSRRRFGALASVFVAIVSLPTFIALAAAQEPPAATAPATTTTEVHVPSELLVALALSDTSRWAQEYATPPAPTTTTTTAPPPPPTTSTTAAPPPPPPPPPAPVPSGACGGLTGLVASYFPADQVGKACQVMSCETGGTFSPTIHNPSSTASGLWQFLDSTWVSTTGTPAPAANYPASTQMAAAASLWGSSGWSQWSCA